MGIRGVEEMKIKMTCSAYNFCFYSFYSKTFFTVKSHIQSPYAKVIFAFILENSHPVSAQTTQADIHGTIINWSFLISTSAQGLEMLTTNHQGGLLDKHLSALHVSCFTTLHVSLGWNKHTKQ